MKYKNFLTSASYDIFIIVQQPKKPGSYTLTTYTYTPLLLQTTYSQPQPHYAKMHTSILFLTFAAAAFAFPQSLGLESRALGECDVLCNGSSTEGTYFCCTHEGATYWIQCGSTDKHPCSGCVANSEPPTC